MAELLSDEEIEARLDGSDWKREGEHIVRDWEFKDFGEAVAFVVGQAVGLQVADASRDYIHLYRGDSKAVMESLERIQQTASLILRSIGVGESASVGNDEQVTQGRVDFCSQKASQNDALCA